MWKDDYGNLHSAVPAGQAIRIVSLVPSLTELICDLGLRENLVGRTGFCVHPKESLRDVTKIGGTKDVNIEKIRALGVTHLIVNIDENEKPTVEKLAEFIPNIIVTHPIAPRDNLRIFRLFGHVFNASPHAEILCQQLEQTLVQVQAQAHVNSPAKKVLYCIWKDPWMTVSRDTYIANMLALRGWQQWQAPNPARYPAFDWNDPSLSDVDLVLLSSEPYRFLPEHAHALSAEIGKPVLWVDGEMLSWYGSRSISGVEYLTKLVIN
jgi:ABC-type Fe3+-hydroxamate transport system substrate-binding protein